MKVDNFQVLEQIGVTDCCALFVARHVHTGGNPFFARQFLAALAEEKLLQFDAGQGVWRWNLPRIQAKGFTDNIADLMVCKLARLPQETQDALARFACLDNAADAATLTIVLERPRTVRGRSRHLFLHAAGRGAKP